MGEEGSRVITLESIEREIEAPTVRLKLKPPQSTSQNHVEECAGIFDRVKTVVKNVIFSPTAPNSTSAEKADALEGARRTAENKEKLESVFACLQTDMNKLKSEAIKGLDGLSADEQSDVIEFWVVVGSYLKETIDYLRRVFSYVLNKIKEGFRICKELISNIFQSIIDFFKNNI